MTKVIVKGLDVNGEVVHEEYSYQSPFVLHLPDEVKMISIVTIEESPND